MPLFLDQWTFEREGRASRLLSPLLPWSDLSRSQSRDCGANPCLQQGTCRRCATFLKEGEPCSWLPLDRCYVFLSRGLEFIQVGYPSCLSSLSCLLGRTVVHTMQGMLFSSRAAERGRKRSLKCGASFQARRMHSFDYVCLWGFITLLKNYINKWLPYLQPV